MAGSWTGINTAQELELLQGASSAQIFVGPDNQCWNLPVDLLCHVSTFFKAALKGGFEEAKEKRVTLKEDDPSAFNLFVLWLYKGNLFEYSADSTLSKFTVKAWVMGDKLGAPAFQNCMMKELLGQNLLYDPEVARYIYDNTSEGSPLRMVAVDMIVYLYEDIKQDQAWKSLYLAGGDVMVDLMEKLQQRWTNGEQPPLHDPSKYFFNS